MSELTREDARMLRCVRRALDKPFIDPVKVDNLPMSRASARKIERFLSGQGVK